MSVFQQVDQIGGRVREVFRFCADLSTMMYLSVRAAVMEPSGGVRTMFNLISTQIYFTGWQAMPLISVLALVTGSLIIINSSAQLSLLGNGEMIGNLMIVIVVRELGPLITALIVIARSGTAVASEIGTMKVHREMDALSAMAINPLSFIVFPRLVGGVLSVLCLAFYFNIIALFGGYIVTTLIHDLTFGFYFNSLAQAISAGDLGLFLLKNLVSGLIIFGVCCYQGLQVKQSPTEVPQVTTKAVVISIASVAIFSLVSTMIVYLNQYSQWSVR